MSNINLSELKDILQILSYLATIIGIPVAIAVFVYQKRKDSIANEIDTYIRAHDRYIQYLTLCLEHHDLGFSECSTNDPEVRKSGFDPRQLTLFSILVSTLEMGFLLYSYQKSPISENQWYGWNEYIKYWTSRSDFRKAWDTIGPEFDKEFQAYTDRLISEVEQTIDP